MHLFIIDTHIKILSKWWENIKIIINYTVSHQKLIKLEEWLKSAYPNMRYKTLIEISG